MPGKPAALCAVCGKPITKAADAVVTHGSIVHRKCAERPRTAGTDGAGMPWLWLDAA
jgi:hypothetical protein